MNHINSLIRFIESLVMASTFHLRRSSGSQHRHTCYRAICLRNLICFLTVLAIRPTRTVELQSVYPQPPRASLRASVHNCCLRQRRSKSTWHDWEYLRNRSWLEGVIRPTILRERQPEGSRDCSSGKLQALRLPTTNLTARNCLTPQTQI